ncbi:MAG: hypothetical protein ACRC41_09295 [Sarcina sp.]
MKETLDKYKVKVKVSRLKDCCLCFYNNKYSSFTSTKVKNGNLF